MNIKLLACSLAIMTTTSLFASPITVEFKGFAYESNSPTSSYVSTFNVSGQGSETVYIGGYSTVVNGGPSFVSYCVDLKQSLDFNKPAYLDYTSTSGPLSPPANSHALGNLFAAAGPVLTPLKSAALQLAVWEVLYETTGTYNVTSGSASFSAAPTVQTEANIFLAHMGSDSVPLQYYVSPTHQDVVTPTPVPEPSPMLMLSMGLGLLGIFKLNKQRKIT